MLPWILSCVFAVTSVVLLIRIIVLKKSINEIISEMEDCLASGTNNDITVSVNDKYSRRIASKMNVQLREIRNQRHKYMSGDRELKDAVTNISHDLRTPLTAICGYLDLLEEEDKSENVSRYISMIDNRAKVLKQLTEELFRYSVISSAEIDDCQPIVLNDVLEESMAVQYASFVQRGITPQISITEDKVKRNLNRSAVSRIFSNIIYNAVKYSDGDFSVEMNSDGKIVFSNTAEKLDYILVGKLFERFYTVETGRNSTGLGLSIARLLTERMGGNINADYVENKLIITLEFPEN